MVIDLRGTCTVQAAEEETSRANFPARASSAVTDGQVLPFSWVNCSVVNSFLSDSTAATPGEQRAYVYGRALARLLAHEQSLDHDEGGIAKARFTPLDVTAERVEFISSIFHRPHRARSKYVNLAWHFGNGREQISHADLPSARRFTPFHRPF